MKRTTSLWSAGWEEMSMGNQFVWQPDPQTRAASNEDLGKGTDRAGILLQAPVQSKNCSHSAVSAWTFRSVWT